MEKSTNRTKTYNRLLLDEKRQYNRDMINKSDDKLETVSRIFNNEIGRDQVAKDIGIDVNQLNAFFCESCNLKKLRTVQKFQI